MSEAPSDLRGRRASCARGAALLEVVTALFIFFIAAVFIMDGLTAGLRAARAAEYEADASDVAVMVLSAVQTGRLEIKSAPGRPIDEKLYPGWTYELQVAGLEDRQDLPLLRRVQVIVRNEGVGFTYRLSQLIWDDPEQEAGNLLGNAGLTDLFGSGVGNGAEQGRPTP